MFKSNNVKKRYVLSFFLKISIDVDVFNSIGRESKVKILIKRFEGKCKYFSSIKLDSYRKLTLTRKVSTNHCFRIPQGNTALGFVIVLYMLVKRQDLNF